MIDKGTTFQCIYIGIILYEENDLHIWNAVDSYRAAVKPCPLTLESPAQVSR